MQGESEETCIASIYYGHSRKEIIVINDYLQAPLINLKPMKQQAVPQGRYISYRST